MPTVLRIGGVRVVMYFNDHRPPHVHILGHGCEAIFNLNGPDGPPILRGNQGFSTGDLNSLETALKANLTTLLSAWDKLHDHHR